MREAWQIARPYWFSEERWFARGLLVASSSLISVGQIWINVRLNSWRNDFNNTLQEYDETEFFYQIATFTVLACGFIVVAVYQTYLQQMLQIRWRRWMTDVYLHEWLAKQDLLSAPARQRRDRQPGSAHRRGPRPVPGADAESDARSGTADRPEAVSFAFILWDLSGVARHPARRLGQRRSFPATCCGLS